LPEGAPGADVVLYGKNWVYTLRMEPRKERTSLFGQKLDSPLLGPGVELHVHEWDWSGSDFTGDTLAVILHHEGVPLTDAREASEYVSEQQLRNPPWPPRRVRE
jgi:hypothetical protein